MPSENLDETRTDHAHDPEETPRQTAKRLVVGDMRKLTESYARLRKRLYLHGRFLASEDKQTVLEFIEGELEQTRTILDGVGEAREFGFPSDLLDLDD